MSEKTSLIPPPEQRPSASLRPKASVFLAKAFIDPQFIVLALVSAVAEGLGKAFLGWLDKRRARKAEKQITKATKKLPRKK